MWVGGYQKQQGCTGIFTNRTRLVGWLVRLVKLVRLARLARLARLVGKLTGRSSI